MLHEKVFCKSTPIRLCCILLDSGELSYIG